MAGRSAGSGTPVGAFARVVFVVGVGLTVGTGLALFAVPGRTADYWAWTIRAPLTAAFFGAGYIGAAVSLALAARTHAWRCTRIVAVPAFTLTTLALIETLRATGELAFDAGGLPELVAWIWLVVYLALPPLVLTAFVVQERAGGAREYDLERAPLGSSRAVLGVAGTVMGALGLALLADWRALAGRWPWPLPSLPATIMGAWFCTVAVALLWFALRERDWSRARIGVAPITVPLALDLVAAVRLREGFDGGTATTVYLAGIALLLIAVATVSVVEERRLRRREDEPGTAVPLVATRL